MMAHAQGAPGIKAAVRAGIRSIDHGIYLDDEAIEMMKARGHVLVPTLVAPLGVIEAADAGAPIPGRRGQGRGRRRHPSRGVRRAVQAGVKIAMGTDSGVTPHGRNLDELALMARGGMRRPRCWWRPPATPPTSSTWPTSSARSSRASGPTSSSSMATRTTSHGFRARIRAVYQDGRLGQRRRLTLRPRFGLQPPCLDGVHEGGVVRSRSGRRTGGEVGEGVVDGVVVAEVGRDRDRVARPGVTAGECPAAQPTPGDQVVAGHRLDDRAALLVLELADVEVASGRPDGPAEEDVGRRLEEALAGDHPLAVVA